MRQAPDPLVSAQMALLRVMHASDMPDPGDLVKQIAEMAAKVPPAPAAENGAGDGPSAEGGAVDWSALVDKVENAGQLRIASVMRDWIRVIAIENGRLEYSLVDGFSGDPAPDIRDALFKLTGNRWQIERGEGEGAPSLREQEEKAEADAEAELNAHPLVKAAKTAFPEAQIVTPNDNVARPDQSGAGRKWSQ